MTHILKPYLPSGGNADRWDGITHWHKFGRNPTVNTTEEDLWNVGGKETLLTTGSSLWIACADNTNGVGQTIRVEGLDAAWEYVSADVVLAGNTPTLIGTASNWTRVHRAYQVSAEPDPVGNVWIGDDDTDFSLGIPATASTVHGLISYTNAAQQTEKCMLTVPAGQEGLVYGFSGAILNTTSGADRSVALVLEVQELAQGATVANPSWAPWRRIDQHGLRSTGDSLVHEDYIFPLGPFPALTNIHVRATASADSEVQADLTVLTYEIG